MGFEPMNTGFADQRVKPLRHSYNFKMLVFPSCQSVHMYNTQVDHIIYSADPTTILFVKQLDTKM